MGEEGAAGGILADQHSLRVVESFVEDSPEPPPNPISQRLPSAFRNNTLVKMSICVITYVLNRCSSFKSIILFILYALLGIAAMVILSPINLLILSLFYFITHIVRLVIIDDFNNKVDKFISYLVPLLFLCSVFVLVELLLCALVVGVSPSLKHRQIHGVSITRWILALAIFCFCFLCTLAVRLALGFGGLLRFQHREKRVGLYEGVIGAVNCLFYLPALVSVTHFAPLLKDYYTIFGLPTQNWIWVVILVALVHHLLCIVTYFIASFLRVKYMPGGRSSGDRDDQNDENSDNNNNNNNNGGRAWKVLCKGLVRFLELFINTRTIDQWSRYIVYYAEGLRMSFNLLLTSLLLLLTWILYFGSSLDRSSSDTVRRVYDIGLWTFVCVLATALLWLVKGGIILTWEAGVVYNRFDYKISNAAKQLYLIGTIAGPKLDIFYVWEEGEGDDDAAAENPDHGNHQANGKMRKNSLVQWRARHILVRKDRSGVGQPHNTYEIMRMARYFMATEVPLSKAGYVSNFIAEWAAVNPRCSREEPHPNNSETEVDSIRNLHGGNINSKDFVLFKTQLMKDNFNITESEKWIVKYHTACLELGRTLAGAMEAVDGLNNIITLVIIFVMVIVWLLLTGIATTKVLVIIASPILAASFIFGESCRTLFNGIMFTYVMHPFDVGDLCTINNVQMEVKRIGLWKTIFSQIGTSDEVVYPNTVLSNVSVVNHKGDFNLNDDYLELELKSTTSEGQIMHLKEKIEKYLDGNQDGLKKNPDHGVLVRDIGQSTVTIVVHFKYDETTIENMMSADGRKKKTDRRHAFLLHLKTLLDEMESTKEEEHFVSPV